ncbi:hypothetical protein BC361_30645 [Ensifer sp. LC54]|nr:hypothetical protein BC361_30645 [Ensifer sp. LC54]
MRTQIQLTSSMRPVKPKRSPYEIDQPVFSQTIDRPIELEPDSTMCRRSAAWSDRTYPTRWQPRRSSPGLSSWPNTAPSLKASIALAIEVSDQTINFAGTNNAIF